MTMEGFAAMLSHELSDNSMIIAMNLMPVLKKSELVIFSENSSYKLNPNQISQCSVTLFTLDL